MHLLLYLLAAPVGGCVALTPPDTLRLVDIFEAERVSGSDVAASDLAPARTEWRFDGPTPSPLDPALASTRGWRANADVQGLAVREGRLEGRTTSANGIVMIERQKGLDDPDLLHAVEVRARISAGANLTVQTRAGAVDLARVQDPFAIAPLTFSTPILPGERFESYTIAVPSSISGARIRSVLLRPSDAKGASFAIESVRLVFRKERLAELPSGVSWQGLSDVYQETIVTRAPQTARFLVTLPRRPVLDLSLGTPDDGPLTFRVTAARNGEPVVPLLERTLTTPHRWERERVELGDLAGARVILQLSLTSERPGAVGFWGAPTVRQLKPAGSQRAHGVILIQGDTLRTDHLDAYGYARPTAPTLKRLADRGVMFRNALSQTGWTKASASSVMTSLYPTSHGVHRIPDRLPASAHTLAESFRAAGYATVGFSSVAFTGRLTNLHQGYDELHESESLPGRSGPYTSKTARPIVDRLVAWLEAHRETPFFVYLHVFDPHSPYEPRPPYNTMWADAARRDTHLEEEERLKAVIGDPFLAERGMATREEMRKAGIDPDEHLRQHKDWYDGSIRGMDDEIARLLERMRGVGVADRTLFAFFADHGEEFQEHGRMWHGQSVYGEMIRVPLVFAGPGILAQPARGDVVQLVDVMPTLLEASGIAAPPGLQGRSLMPLLTNGRSGAWTPRPAIAEKNAMAPSGFPNAAESLAIVDGEWKLVHNLVRPPDKPEHELYAFLKDPLDQKDVAREHPEIVARLAQALAAWRRGALQARLRPDSESTEGMTSEQLEKLRSLGYVQ
ncbi:MAG TPA: sulfatase [Vicinamibacteria bacterium]|nr:sulfatase [Vicinamibacteria bacterium]